MPVHRTERPKSRARGRNNCPFCKQYFPGKSLKTHVEEIHLKGRRPTPDDPLHICTFPGCDKWFIQRTNLQTHAKMHTGVRDKICPHLVPSESDSGELEKCLWNSGDPASLTRHRRDVHGYRPSHKNSVDPWVTEESSEHHGGTLNWDEARGIQPGRSQVNAEANGPRKSRSRPSGGTPARTRNRQSPTATRPRRPFPTLLLPPGAVGVLGIPPNPRAIALILQMQGRALDAESILAQAAGPSRSSLVNVDVPKSRSAEAQVGSSPREQSPTPEPSQVAEPQQEALVNTPSRLDGLPALKDIRKARSGRQYRREDNGLQVEFQRGVC
ncbi:unnamed protein product [Somion occarium]|uniref:C2H2-type domain-containing protein n=1 Tax=Somion occarium TaxID=3059160 RepID=A0ABP1DQ50_9APHY